MELHWVKESLPVQRVVPRRLVVLKRGRELTP